MHQLQKYKHMKNKLLYIIFIFSFLLINSTVNSLSLRIKNVSVINNQGHVRISWEYTGTDDLEIFRDSTNLNSLMPLHTITNQNTISFVDLTAQAHIKPRLYKIQSALNPSLDATDIVTTFHLTYNYDSCLQQIQLNWKDATLFESEWEPTNFKVHIIENGNEQVIYISASNTEYIASNIQNNNAIELYNLKEDIGEQNNLAAIETAKRDELIEELLQWQKNIKAPIPTDPNPEYQVIENLN